MLLANRNLLERFYYPQTEGEKFVKRWTSLVLAGLPIGLWLINLHSLRSVEDVRKFVTSSMFVGAVLMNAIVHIAGRIIASMVKAANPNTELVKTLREKGPETSDYYIQAAEESYYDSSCLKDIDYIYIYEQDTRIQFFGPVDTCLSTARKRLIEEGKKVLFVAHMHNQIGEEAVYEQLKTPAVTGLKEKFNFIIIHAPQYEAKKVIEAICDRSRWKTADQLVKKVH